MLRSLRSRVFSRNIQESSENRIQLLSSFLTLLIKYIKAVCTVSVFLMTSPEVTCSSRAACTRWEVGEDFVLVTAMFSTVIITRV